MIPDFNAKVIEIVAKRAAYCCSNPDCGVSTIGPNSDIEKATVIGEAAHIKGARSSSARYDSAMSDAARGEITNAIWLCRNCHKKIDRDSELYSEDLLFSWREEHETAITKRLGNKSDQLRNTAEKTELAEFASYPPIIRRIIIDQPAGWEWRLTAELMRYLNRPTFRRMNDLRQGHYTHPLESVADEDLIEWMQTRMAEMSSLIGPMEGLMERLTASWGEQGVAGDIDEIHHTCCLIQGNLKQIVEHEERTRFVRVSDDFEKLISLLQDCLGSQADKLQAIPDKLDEVVGMLDELSDKNDGEPTVIHQTIDIVLPPNWTKDMEREMRRAERILSGENPDGQFSDTITGILGLILIVGLVIWIFS